MVIRDTLLLGDPRLREISEPVIFDKTLYSIYICHRAKIDDPPIRGDNRVGGRRPVARGSRLLQ